MLRIAKLLPASKTPTPSEKLVLQWYYMTYYRADCAEYVKSRKSWLQDDQKSHQLFSGPFFSEKNQWHA
jgi:hypothetical protein